MAERFTGIPAEAFEFYDRLAVDNTRTWWQANRGDYERFVREPLTHLVDELADEFGTPKLFRPYRDARFSKDKTPIKDHQGAVVGVEDARFGERPVALVVPVRGENEPRAFLDAVRAHCQLTSDASSSLRTCASSIELKSVIRALPEAPIVMAIHR